MEIQLCAEFQIIQYRSKKMIRVGAAHVLSRDVCTLSRMAKVLKLEGLGGAVHGKPHETSWNKLDACEAERIKSLVLLQYQNYKITHPYS